MKVYLITVTTWDGYNERVGADCVKSSEELAIEFCNRMNAGNKSSYSPVYDYEEFDVEDW